MRLEHETLLIGVNNMEFDRYFLYNISKSKRGNRVAWVWTTYSSVSPYHMLREG